MHRNRQMTDVFTAEARSGIMRRVRSQDTAPERKVRSAAHRLGYRFRLHGKDLPGCPDLVFPSRQKVIFVHGCFWHGHDCPRGKRIPVGNADYWRSKIGRNIGRDMKNQSAFRLLGWQYLILWECELRDEDRMAACIQKFLSADGRQ